MADGSNIVVRIEPEEVVQIAADRDRYKAALERFVTDRQAYCIEDGHACYHGWPPLQHIESCPVRIAGEALAKAAEFECTCADFPAHDGGSCVNCGGWITWREARARDRAIKERSGE